VFRLKEDTGDAWARTRGEDTGRGTPGRGTPGRGPPADCTPSPPLSLPRQGRRGYDGHGTERAAAALPRSFRRRAIPTTNLARAVCCSHGGPGLISQRPP
jgi:hypothetical protein